MQLINAQTDRLGVMLLLAAAAHAFFILGITFKPFDPTRPQHRQQSLEVIVVNQAAEPPEEDEKPDFLAQTSQRGGGEQRKPVKPIFEESPPPLPPSQPRKVKPQPRQQRLTTEISPQKTEQEKPPEKLPLDLSASQLLTSRKLEIARLTAELERKTRAYAKMPKRKAISANTKEYKYAAYLDAWRRKVERIGNLNYPDQAKRNSLYGNLVLHVAVLADGSVERIRVLHSSGHKTLDDAAVRIVRMSAPFSPFPEEIRKETDILDITRTWQFLSGDQFGSE
jgi:protein TonB